MNHLSDHALLNQWRRHLMPQGWEIVRQLQDRGDFIPDPHDRAMQEAGALAFVAIMLRQARGETPVIGGSKDV